MATAVMSEEYPAFIEPLSPYCLVRARAASIHADGPDDGSNPDWMPAVDQKVVFTPSISGQLLTYDAGTDDSIIVTVEPVEATTNADGWFVSKSGKRIHLLATDDPRLSATGWTWSVNINRRDVRFSAPSGGVIDLASFITAPAVDATLRWIERIPDAVDSATTAVDAAATAVEARDTATEQAGLATTARAGAEAAREDAAAYAAGANVQRRTLTGPTDISTAAWPTDQLVTVAVTQDATGGRSLSIGGVPVAVKTAPGAVTWIVCAWSDGWDPVPIQSIGG